MLDLSEEFLEVKFKGKIHKLRHPTIKDSKLLKEKTKSESEEDAMIWFLTTLGMDLDSAESLTGLQIQQIVEGLNSKKK
jgi:hypothetical protein